MQGKRSTVSSLPEILDLDNIATSSTAGIDQSFWLSDTPDPTEHGLSDFMLSPSDTSMSYLDSVTHVGHNLIGQSLGESGSRNTRLEEPQYETNININQISNGSMFIQGSGSNTLHEHLNLNAGFLGIPGADHQVAPCGPSAGSSSNFLGASGSNGYLVEERPGCSMEGRRMSCKRKAYEANIGQSSSSHGVWNAVPTRFDTGNSHSTSTTPENIPSEQLDPRLGLGIRGVPSDSLPGLSVPGNASAERSRRNLRVRINQSNHHSSAPPNLGLSSGSRHANVSSTHLSTRLHQSLDLRSAATADNSSPQSQSVVFHSPAPAQRLQSMRWNEPSSLSSSSRAGHPSSSVISGERDVELNSRSLLRNFSEHPMFASATEMRTIAEPPSNWTVTGGNTSAPGNVVRVGSVVHPSSSSSPALVPPNAPSRYPQRLTELVRRSLASSSGGSESGGRNSNYSLMRSSTSGSLQQVALPSGSANPHQLRSVRLMERQGDGVLGAPYPLRTFASTSEGRSRLASEIRGVLDLMRRGEGLRFEDVVFLDPSVVFGVADIHDRHRDMRLDVDNMSYEELLALEERIGNVNTGLTEGTILSKLKQRKFTSIGLGIRSEIEPCCVCQEEYVDGEDLGTLDCGHDFHTGCIQTWLMQKNLCPICKTTALLT